MSQSDTFKSIVRKGNVPGPQQQAFSREKWMKGFRQSGDASKEGDNLYKVGLFIDDELTAARRQLTELKIEEFPATLQLRGIVGFLNRELESLKGEMLKYTSKKSRSSAVFLDNIIARRVKSELTKSAFTADEVITLLHDSAPYALNAALLQASQNISVPSRISDTPQNLGRLSKAIILAQAYHAYSDIWLNCLWLDCQLKEQDGFFIFIPPDSLQERAAAVWSHRQASLVTSTAIQLQKQFEGGSLSGLAEYWRRKRTVNSRIAVPGSSERYNVGLNRPLSGSLPRTLAAELLALEDYIAPFLDFSLPKLQNLSLRDLLDAWRIVNDIATLEERRFPRNTGVFSLERLIEFAPLVSNAALSQALSEAMRKPLEVANSIVDFFTYAPRKPGGLWAAPIVNVSQKKKAIVLGPLYHGNLVRAAEFWLRNAGFDFRQRGPKYEDSVRGELTRRLLRSTKLKDAEVYGAAIEIGPAREEMDLSIRIGNTVLIGEVKCNVFPSDPLERYNFITKELDDATSIQIPRKISAINNNFDEFCSITGWKNLQKSHTKLVPFVLINTIFGSGYVRNGVPVLDMTYLCEYMSGGGIEFSAVFQKEVEGHVSGVLQEFYADERDAEQNCERHFANPPMIRFLEEASTITFHQVPSLLNRSVLFGMFVIDPGKLKPPAHPLL